VGGAARFSLAPRGAQKWIVEADNGDNVTNNLKINYLELPARDIEAAKSFYRETFGWTFTDYGPDYAAFNDGFIDGGFYRSPNSSSTTENGAALIVFYAEALELVRESVLKHGGAIVKDIFAFPGGRRFHFADPVGNEMAVWSDH
jgi:predicted enzyme related to lactoylglutathione lyase